MSTDTKKILKITAISILVIFIAVYGFFRTKDLVFGVRIIEVNLTDGQNFEDNILEVRGNARNAVKLTLNGREISIDQEGNFKETIALLSGYNRVNIQAEDKFGNRDEKNYQLMY